ncbi:gamma-glutamyl-gamma-aminobutyrate hydrolase family protein [Streptomyces actinomycinicus]|uniref:Gamma-glutamyl-gamma-aminobutyrate hydrolase family protein n=1 Tax=Streptomyces actinomycinicus TaxID=1695166 RepID=A0A937JU76_9ACTN|nr:gamma-glutamyl-gamma-aminobutyrate hydrolase family protein [Streptomyces actinomycinicus]MBL1087568.1 gamma-glutamyl-gamma-aminobutyrate hydrolase family protein [Streptomyces actinomycinicus]
MSWTAEVLSPRPPWPAPGTPLPGQRAGTAHAAWPWATEHSRPVIGVSGYPDRSVDRRERPAASVALRPYLDGLARAGAAAALLQPWGHSAWSALDAIDGLLIPAGPDVDPLRYGAEAHPMTGCPDRAQDAWEFALLREALMRDLPVLGVSRGMHLLNITFGGTLLQHLPDRLGSRHRPEQGFSAHHMVRVGKWSLLSKILSSATPVRCFHHQGVARLGAGLLPAAWSQDELVEAIELPDRRCVLGVQWRPDADPQDSRLFEAFVAASARR